MISPNTGYHNPFGLVSERKRTRSRRRLRLHDFPMWKHMASDEVELMLEIATVKGYARGETLFNPLDEPNRLHLLQLGRVMTYVVTPQGQKKILHIFSPGDAFGALLLGAVDGRLPWAEALEDVVVCSMSETDFLRFMQDCPNLCIDLLKYMSHVHVEAMRRLQSLVHTRAEERVVMGLLDIGRRLGVENEHEFTVSDYFTQEDIGNLVGLVRTTVSESISALNKMGIVRKDGRRLIVNRSRAEEYLENFI